MSIENVKLTLNQILDYIPEYLREKPIYQKVACLLHFVSTSPDVYNMDLVKDFYDVIRTQEITKLEKLLGSEPAVKLWKLSRRERRTFLQFIKTVYQLKGTKRGLQMVLSLLGASRVELYEWFEINEDPERFGVCADLVHLPFGDPGPPIHNQPNLYHCHPLFNPCTYMIVIPQVTITRTNPSGAVRVQNILPGLASLDFEETLIQFLSKFIHVCVQLEILRIKVQIDEVMDVCDEVTPSTTVFLNNTVCTDNPPRRLERQSYEEFRVYRKIGRAGYHIGLSEKIKHERGGPIRHSEDPIYRHGMNLLLHNYGYIGPNVRFHGESCLFHNGITPYYYHHGDNRLKHLQLTHGAALHGRLKYCHPFLHSITHNRHGDTNVFHAEHECSCEEPIMIHKEDCTYTTYDYVTATELTQMRHQEFNLNPSLLSHLAPGDISTNQIHGMTYSVRRRDL